MSNDDDRMSVCECFVGHVDHDDNDKYMTKWIKLEKAFFSKSRKTNNKKYSTGYKNPQLIKSIAQNVYDRFHPKHDKLTEATTIDQNNEDINAIFSTNATTKGFQDPKFMKTSLFSIDEEYEGSFVDPDLVD